jgi:hypothetical protein
MVVTVRWMQYIVMNDVISSLFLFFSPPYDSIIASPPSSDVTIERERHDLPQLFQIASRHEKLSMICDGFWSDKV